MHLEETKLKEFILDSGLVSEADYSFAEKDADLSNSSPSRMLVNAGKLSESDWRRSQAYVFGIPFVSLKGLKIDFDTLSLIPEPIARTHNIIAFKKSNDSLEIAMLDAEDLEAIDFVKKKTGLNIMPRLTDVESIKNALLQYQKSLKDEFGDIIQKELKALKIVSTTGEATANDLKKLAEDIPIVRIVDTLLKHAVLQSASDIHIEPLEKDMVVRYRIDGILHDAMILPRDASSSVTARIKVLSNLKLDEKRLPQDGRFKIELDGEKISFRVSIMPTYFGEKTVMRVLKENSKGFSLEALGFHGRALETLHWATKLTTGMILTTGPTGSGKTTTLYTVLDLLNTPNVNISTIEDPIEYQMNRVNQTQVKPEIGFSFANGLRTLVRQDPDIIMVGEIRDNETASLAINAALTGHLVLSTLHTNSAAGAIPRLLDMKAEPFLLVSTLDVVIGQRLVRRLTSSKEKYFLTNAEIESLKKEIDMDRVLALLKEENIVKKDETWTSVPFYRPIKTEGFDDGYKGRFGIIECLRVTSSIKEMIMRGNTEKEIEGQAKKEGMMTMIEDGVFKAAQGFTTLEEVLRVISE